jgi:hypothetical protein
MKEIVIMTVAGTLTVVGGCAVGLALLQFTNLAPLWSMLAGTAAGMAVWCTASARFMRPPQNV